MSTGLALALVALVLALIITGLFRLVAVLDSTETALRRLVGDLRRARRAVDAAGDLAGTIERDAAAGRTALGRLEDLRGDLPGPDRS